MKFFKTLSSFCLLMGLEASLSAVQFEGDKSGDYKIESQEGENIVFGYQGGVWSKGNSTDYYPIRLNARGDMYVGYNEALEERPLTGVFNIKMGNYFYTGGCNLYFSNAAVWTDEVRFDNPNNLYFRNAGSLVKLVFDSNKSPDPNAGNTPKMDFENSGRIDGVNMLTHGAFAANAKVFADGSRMSFKDGSHTGVLLVQSAANVDFSFEKGSKIGSSIALVAEACTLHFAAQKFELDEGSDFYKVPEKCLSIRPASAANLTNLLIFDVESAEVYGCIEADSMLFQRGMGGTALTANLDIQLNMFCGEDAFEVGDELVLLSSAAAMQGDLSYLEGRMIDVAGFSEIAFMLSVDENSVRAVAVSVPEPSVCAALFGALALFIPFFRRK